MNNRGLVLLVALVGIGGYFAWKSKAPGANDTAAPRTSTSDVLRGLDALAGTGLDSSRADILRPTDVLSGTATENPTSSGSVPGPTASDSMTAYILGQVEAF